MSTENKNIVRRLYDEVWNKRKLDLVPELISPSHALLDPLLSGSQVGPEPYRRRIQEFAASFPDLRFTLDDLIAEKEKVAAAWVFSGTHKGDFMNIPATGKKVSVEGITIHYIRNGKILDSNARWDAMGLLRQLGALPAIGRSKEAASKS
ncbi:MAG TPA: ester cyclase [Verrucomicrobiae bacterium]|nr:ester cyclase [Verrucomicrobiae bacterium]